MTSTPPPETTASVPGPSFGLASRTLGDDLRSLEQLAEQGPVTFGQLVDALHDRAGTSLLVILSFAFMLVPVPGVSTAASLLFFALTFTAILGTRPYLPEFARRRTISQPNAKRMIAVASKGWSRMEKLVKPRFTLLSVGPFRWLAGLSLFTAIVAFALPIPIPFNNTPPAFCMLLLGLGLLGRDGIMLLLGHLCNAVMWIILVLAGDFLVILIQKLIDRLS